ILSRSPSLISLFVYVTIFLIPVADTILSTKVVFPELVAPVTIYNKIHHSPIFNILFIFSICFVVGYRCPFSHLDTRECLTSKISAKSFCVILFSFLYFFISSPRFSIFFFIGDFTSLDKASSTDQPFFNLAPILSGLILYISPHSTKVKDSPL